MADNIVASDLIRLLQKQLKESGEFQVGITDLRDDDDRGSDYCAGVVGLDGFCLTVDRTSVGN